MESGLTLLINWPHSPFYNDLVRTAIGSVDISRARGVLQWSTYDEIDHQLTNSDRRTVLSSCYTFRKALIRKHFLSRAIHQRLAKYPDSVLDISVPRTYELELSFADELDELFTDELWQLGRELDQADDDKWWILKPSMADRGQGIRLFNSKSSLERIFLRFEEMDEDDSTAVITSQLRHFVVQEYIARPLLMDPSEALHPNQAELKGYKFHLRAYCVASRALNVYLYDRVLALFSSSPYCLPQEQDDMIDMSPHLTNSSIQQNHSEDHVRLLDELVGCHVLSGEAMTRFTERDMENLFEQMTETLAETFKAALDTSVHFQAIPNAFELFGVDFLVSHVSSNGLRVKLLEMNAEPAIELTGRRLEYILQDLFISMAKVCVVPFFMRHTKQEEPWLVGERREHFIKCLQQEVRGGE